ncbi:MAG: PD-(D/E)XK nuclease family protein [Chloroflexi bacterium]|nr:PD-(D/E)XK nuclease family protein [Chloroflexota bacterium]
MTLTIEILPDPAANDLRLTQLAAQRPSLLSRLNILHGSALQRLSTQRMLAEATGGALAGVYGFTPVDLAQAAASFGHAPARHAWPAGADLTALRHVLRDLKLEALDPQAPGVAAALLRSLTDLREAALTSDDLADGDLKLVFNAWRETTADIADRTSRYEDATSASTPDSAFIKALGGAPLIVSGIYDLTRIQRLLFKRLAEATDVRMLLVAPSNDPASPPRRTVSAIRRELNVRVIHSQIAPANVAADRYFSVGDPTAEADEIAARILELATGGTAFHHIAILHQQGAPTDDRLSAALERADIPTWRIGGRQLTRTPIGHAAQRLARVLLSPETVERAELLDWLSHRSLRQRLLDHHRHPAQWERVSVDAGLTRNLFAMEHRLDLWSETTQSRDAGDLAEDLAKDLVAIARDLSTRSRKLQDADSWANASDLLLEAFDQYFDADSADQALRLAAREILDQLRSHDRLGSDWSAQDGLTALGRAMSSRVVRDPRRLIGGVNIGAATGPARGIRYDAIFAAGVAERIFPAVGRQDPLLTDADRAAINEQIPDALALQRDRGDSDRHAWQLMRRAARRQFSASWSRRSSAVGGPARPSSLILETAAASSEDADQPRTESSLYEAGRIQRIESGPVTRLPTPAEIESDDWTATVAAPDEQSFNLALLASPDSETRAALAELWPEAEAAEHARLQRNAPVFTDFDGQLDSAQTPNLLGDDWQPLDRTWSARAIETFVTCPYRFYLRYIVDARADAEPARPDQPRRDVLGRLFRQILSTWAQTWVGDNSDQTWVDYTSTEASLSDVAHQLLDSAAEAGALGPPASVPALRDEVSEDLERARRLEASDARDGWSPVAVDAQFEDAPIRVTGGRNIHFSGRIDRIDVHADGRQRARSYFTGKSLPDVRGFVNGSSFLAIANLTALTQRGVPIRQAEVELRSATRPGDFVSQTLLGESLTTRGGRSAPSDGERLRDTLALIADQLESANFIPYPGNPPRDRPNCRHCPYESTCTADIAERYQKKSRQDQDAVRQLEILRRQRV